MKITRKEVEHVALLGRLAVDAAQAEDFTRQLNEIFEHFEKLNELDTSQVEPTFHVLQMQNVFREDRVRPSLDVSEVLANAPDRDETAFRVPRVVE